LHVTASSHYESSLYHAGYEAALAVLERQRNALQRSPSLTPTLNEEQIRLLLLAGLNTVFEGQALGEVFNKQGRTGILVRANDAGVFADCEIWDGPAVVAEGIGRLLCF
jgi:hypothetical protein